MKKRLTALILAALMLSFSAVSCVKDGENDPDKQNVNGEAVGENTEKPTLLKNVFASSALELSGDYVLKNNFTPVYDKDKKTISTLAYNNEYTRDADGNITARSVNFKLFTYDKDGKLLSETAVNPTYKTTNEKGEEVEEKYDFASSTLSGNILYFISVDYDPNTYEQAYYLHSYDIETGEMKDSGELSALFSATDRRWFYINYLAASSDGYVYLAADSEIVVLDSSLVKQYSVTVSSWIRSVSTAPDGKVYVSGYFGDDLGIAILDNEKKALGDAVSIKDINFSELTFDTEGNLYAEASSGVYKVNTADGTTEIVMNYENSNINSSNSELKVVADADTMIISTRNDETYHYDYYLCKKTDDIDISTLKVVEFVTSDYFPQYFASAVVEYNREHKDSRIVTKSYLSYSEGDDYLGGQKQLYKDISLGLCKPDVIIDNPYYSRQTGVSVADYLIKNNLFVDLNTLIEKSSKIDGNDIFKSVKDTLSTDDGRMFGICDSFSVSTLVGASENLGGKTSWTLSEFLDFAKNIPAGSSLLDPYVLQNDILQSGSLGTHLFDEFIDMENGTCNFETENFAGLLEFIKTLPSEYNYNDNDDNNQNEKYQTGRVLLTQGYLSNTDSWLSYISTFGGKDFTFIGYPSSDGKGAELNIDDVFTITTYCEYPDVAFDFISDYITPVYDEMRGGYRMYKFPIFKSAVEVECNNAEKLEYFFYIDGGWSSRYKDEARYEENAEGFTAYFTEEDKAELFDFLENKCRGSKLTSIPNEVKNIISEEISSYTSGVKSAEQCANVIQSRVKIWLAEHSS